MPRPIRIRYSGAKYHVTSRGNARHAIFHGEEDSLHYHGHRAGTPKAVAVELCCELSGKSQREIAKYYGYKTDSGVTRQRWVIGQKTAEDESLVRQIEKLRRKLVKCKIKV